MPSIDADARAIADACLRPELDAVNVMHTDIDDVDLALRMLGPLWDGPVGVYPHRGTSPRGNGQSSRSREVTRPMPEFLPGVAGASARSEFAARSRPRGQPVWRMAPSSVICRRTLPHIWSQSSNTLGSLIA
jgi:hypothetical protein